MAQTKKIKFGTDTGKGKDDFGVSRDLQIEETQTQASHPNHISYILLATHGMFYSKQNT